MAANLDSLALASDTLTRGCRMPYPRTTRPTTGSYSARLSGWAMVPISAAAPDRGRTVSASSVMT